MYLASANFIQNYQLISSEMGVQMMCTDGLYSVYSVSPFCINNETNHDNHIYIKNFMTHFYISSPYITAFLVFKNTILQWVMYITVSIWIDQRHKILYLGLNLCCYEYMKQTTWTNRTSMRCYCHDPLPDLSSFLSGGGSLPSGLSGSITLGRHSVTADNFFLSCVRWFSFPTYRGGLRYASGDNDYYEQRWWFTHKRKVAV